MKTKTASIVCGILLLSACGGGSTGNISLPDLIKRANAFEAAVGSSNIEELTPTPDNLLPADGSASFTGVAFAGRESANEQDGSGFAAFGSSTLTINFVDGTVSGKADNFYQATDPSIDDINAIKGTEIAGSVKFDLSQETDGKNQFLGRAAGYLIESDGAAFKFDLPAGGALAGADGEGFAVEAFEEDGLVGFGILALKD